MVGALAGGLLLVLAVGCTMRHYGRRSSSIRSQSASQLTLRHSVSLPANMGYDDGLQDHRDPPPAYSVAILPPPPATALSPGAAPRGHRPLLSGRRQPKATHRLHYREVAPTAPVLTEAATPVPPANQLLLTESAYNQLLLTESADNQLLLTESADNQLLLTESADNQLLLTESADNQLLLTESADNQLLLTESADNQLLLTEAANNQLTEPANNQLLTESADNQLLTGTTPPATNYCSDDTIQLIDA
ncbi:uncharacterized protein LOC111050299 isoform X1 [Nilaparvata lugens]|uniref:uncharacterized protein LOC111050299 isoform X1 n=1 Tax=Nilaparvata lugens TaxID=108931 RepID=UPI00193EB639|nr:uncharacterized protein LOC111050299 isoform X1 [Nilaparvata lugens]